jgi:olfactory receptor
MIVDIQVQNKIISFVDCMTQMSLFISFRIMDDMLLTVMAYDRFVSICHPLDYSVIINLQFCVLLLSLCFLFSLCESQVHNLIALYFTHLKDVEIFNFFCETSQLLNLACYDTFTKNLVLNLVGAISDFLLLLGIFLSYYKIFSSIFEFHHQMGSIKPFTPVGLIW